MDGTQTSTTTPGQSGPGSHGNEGCTPHSPDLQNWSLTIRYSLVSYPEHLFFFCVVLGVLNLCRGNIVYSKPCQQLFRLRDFPFIKEKLYFPKGVI